MSDQTWAVIIGAGVVAVLRIIDFFFPKGRWYNWGGKTSKGRDEDDRREEEDDGN